MSEESLSAILEAESHTEETRGFIKQVRRITKRKFTSEEKIRNCTGGVPSRGTDKGFMSQGRYLAQRILCLAKIFYGGW